MCRYLAGEVIVIRYQHIAGCQSLYSYILTTRPTPEAHHEVHGDRIRMAARALASSAGWLTLTLNHEVNPLSVLPLCSGSSPGMRGDAGGCQVAPESAPDAGRARIPPSPLSPFRCWMCTQGWCGGSEPVALCKCVSIASLVMLLVSPFLLCCINRLCDSCSWVFFTLCINCCESGL